MSDSWYRPVGREVEIFDVCVQLALPVLLKGPTGCGKSRFVEAMAARHGRPCVTVVCNAETSATDLVGRWLIQGGETTWHDGPVSRAVKQGAFLYLDEVAEARDDVLIVLHPLADFRRRLFVDRLNAELEPAPGFQLVASFNPGYRYGIRELKQSTRQRFVAMTFGYPQPDVEAEIVTHESGVAAAHAAALVDFARKVRATHELGLVETISTRLLVDCGRMITAGLHPRLAVLAGAVHPITDDPDTLDALAKLVELRF